MTRKNFFNMLFVGITIFGTLVGAGFASGKEIWYYFSQWGNISYVAIVVVCLLFCGTCFLFFSFGKTFQIQSVQQCSSLVFGKMASVFEVVLILSNMALLSSMFAGADSLFLVILPNFPYRLASVLTALITLLVVCFGFRGVSKTNAFVVPLLIFMIVLVLILCLFDGRTAISSTNLSLSNFSNSTLYTFLYVGSNMFFSGFMFARMGKEFTKKELLGGTIFGCVFLFLCLLVMNILLLTNPSSVASDIPILDIALSLDFKFACFVLIVIWLGLLTTALALLYTISNWLKTFFGNTALVTAIASVFSLALSGIGFSSFVKIIYPIMGVLGIFYVLCVALKQKSLKTTKQKNSKRCF